MNNLRKASFGRLESGLYKVLLFTGLSGYEIGAGITALLEVPSTPVSISIRLFTAVCALIAVSIGFSKALIGSRRVIFGFLFFWYLYTLRIAYDTSFTTVPLGFSASYYYSWALGSCALPMLGIAVWSPKVNDSNKNFKSLFIVVTIGGLLASFGASPFEVNNNNELVNTGRLQLAALNPILLGQLGATLVLLSVWAFQNRVYKYSVIEKLLLFLSVAVGCGLLLGSNSRGPLVSAIAGFLFMALMASKKSRLLVFTLFLFSASAFIPVTRVLEAEFGISTYSRIFGQSQMTEDNTLDRLNRYDSALAALMDNPFFGSGLEDEKYGGYPHNIFIEAGMATGIFGGLLLFVLVAVTFIYAVRIYKDISGYGWVSVIFVQYLTAAQFSGSIYTVNYLWISSGLVIAVYASLVPSFKRRQFGFSSIRALDEH